MQGVNATRVAKPVLLNAEDDRRLRILSKRKRIEAQVQLRARIVLLAAAGMSDKDIAATLDTKRRVAARTANGTTASGLGRSVAMVNCSSYSC